MKSNAAKPIDAPAQDGDEAHDVDKVKGLLVEWAREKRYGRVSVEFHGGRVKLVTEEKTSRPSDLK